MRPGIDKEGTGCPSPRASPPVDNGGPFSRRFLGASFQLLILPLDGVCLLAPCVL